MLMRLLLSYWFYGILLLAGVVVFSLVQTTQIYQIEQGTQLAIDTPRLVMHRVNTTQFDQDGKVKLTVNADGAAQFADNRLSLSNPLVVLFTDNRPTTFLRSSRADIRGSHFHLTGLVKLSTNEQSDLLTGETLDYNRDSNQMEITKPIITIQDESTINNTTARNLKVDGETSRLWLSGQVTTRVTRTTQ